MISIHNMNPRQRFNISQVRRASNSSSRIISVLHIFSNSPHVTILSSTTYLSQMSGQCCILGMKAKVWEYHLPSHRIRHGTHTLRRMHHTPTLPPEVFSPLTQQNSDLSPLRLARVSRSCKHSCRVLVLSVCWMRWHGLAQAFRTTR